MRLTLKNTKHIIHIEKDGVTFPARVWEGHSDSGIYVQALIVRIGVDGSADQEEFLLQLEECEQPKVPDVFPARMVM
jgi:hypothetical protein